MSEKRTSPGMRERSFVGREDLLSAFDEALAAVPADEVRVLAFHGLGGIGKSRLIQRLRGEGQDPRWVPDSVVNAKIDFRDPENRLPVKALERARAQLHRQGVPFPTFDIAFAVWWRLANPSTGLKEELPAFLDATEVSGEIIGTLEEVPVLGLVSKIPKAMVKLGKAHNEWRRKRGKKEVADIAGMTDHHRIAGWLPRFFGADLAEWREEVEGRGAVLFFDTHEALFTERGSEESGAVPDAWLIRWAVSLPGTLVVVSGRNSLRWLEEDGWNGRIHQKKVTELRPDESSSFLLEAGVEDTDLRLALVEKSRGVPQYLELAAATHQKIENERQPIPEDFDTNLGKLLQRFLSYVSVNERQSLFVLSVPETFDYPLYRDLMKEFRTGPSTRQSLISLTRFSFISESDPERYALHALVRDALASEQPLEDRRDIHKFLFDRAAKALDGLLPREIGEAELRALQEGVAHGSEFLEPEKLAEWFLKIEPLFDQAGEWALLEELLRLVLDSLES